MKYELCIRDGDRVHIRIEYRTDLVKTMGHTSRESFLLSDRTVSEGTWLSGTRRHNWPNLTTRRHYPGEHRIVLLVNGREVAYSTLMLCSLEEQSHKLGYFGC